MFNYHRLFLSALALCCVLQVKAASWALERDISVVIADGFGEETIRGIMLGKKVGTFFTTAQVSGTSVDMQAANGA